MNLNIAPKLFSFLLNRRVMMHALIILTFLFFPFPLMEEAFKKFRFLMNRSILGILANTLMTLIIYWPIFAIFLFTVTIFISFSIILSHNIHSVLSSIASLLLAVAILSLVSIIFLNTESLVSPSLRKAMGVISVLTFL